MKLIDLHIHSNASDGTCSPSEVVALAIKKELTAIALTDHDTVAGIDEAILAASGTGLEMVPGIEISCIYEGTELHILGYYVDHHSESLQTFLDDAQKKRTERNLEMLAAFQKDGFSITLPDLQAENPATVITRAHFARALTERGYVPSPAHAFKKYLNPGCPYYRDREKITPEDAISALLSAGAFPVLAHPCQYQLGWAKTDALISYLKELGLKGVECYHSSNNQDESGKLKRIASAYKLAPTGGSDFHGSNKPDIEIGSGRGNLRVSALLLDDIKLSMFLGL